MPATFIRSSLKPTCLFGLILALGTPLTAGDWPQWRGPRGDSVSEEKGLPVHWSENKSVVWKTALPEWGTSTPAIWGNSIFLTTHEEQNEGKLLLMVGVSLLFAIFLFFKAWHLLILGLVFAPLLTFAIVILKLTVIGKVFGKK